MLIRRAFTTLLRQKPIQSISVKELCELAEINRGTFYAHYTDIYDLRDQIEQEMQTDFAKALEPLLSLDDSQLTDPGDRRYFPMPGRQLGFVCGHPRELRRQGICDAAAEYGAGKMHGELYPLF